MYVNPSKTQTQTPANFHAIATKLESDSKIISNRIANY